MKLVLIKIAVFVFMGSIFLDSAYAAKGHPNLVGPEVCIDCHKAEGKSWQQSHHFLTFKKLHRRKEAKKIAKNLGIKRIKKDSACFQCHYTLKKNKPIAGISCESCHGPAKGWLKVHNDYGGKDIKKDQESAAHKTKRIKQSIAAGMIRPDDIYAVAKNCFECHTVPYERLVNVGGHKAGSKFELVSWSQGEVRHNYFQTDNNGNKEASQDRKRLMYVVGRMLDLEFGLRGVAEVTKKTKYAKKMAKRVKKALGHIEAIKKSVNNPAVNEIYSIGKSAKMKPNNKRALLKAATKVSKLAQGFAKKTKGSSLAAVDSLIPTKTKGTAAP